MKKIPAIIILAVVLFFQPSVAQESESAAKGDAAHGSAFRVTCMGEWSGPELFARNDGKWERLDILDMGLSQSIRFVRGTPIVLARKVIEGGKEKYMSTLALPIPEDCLSPLVLLTLQSDKSIRPFVTDMNQKSFPYGGYKLVNLTAQSVHAQFGNKRFVLKAGNTEVVNPGLGKKARIPIMIVLRRDKIGAEILYSNMVINRPGKRMIMFLYPEKTGDGEDRTKVRSLVDFRQ